MIVYKFSDPIRIPALLAVPIVLWAIINFRVKSDGIQARLYSVVPAVFLPTAFLAGILALVLALTEGRITNSWTIALATVCATCIMVTSSESKYADYS